MNPLFQPPENGAVIALPALQDNYIWLYHITPDRILVIDPGEAAPVLEYCQTHHVVPHAILITHHHADHLDGALAIADHFNGVPIYAPDEVTLPHLSVNGLHTIRCLDRVIEILPVPGHTLQHVAYRIDNVLFSGDTLFSGGCGRLFEGSYEQLFNSLRTLQTLPDETLVCAGHEYTGANLRFGHFIDPDNMEISDYLSHLTSQSRTLPSTIAREKAINPFFYPAQSEAQKRLKQRHQLDNDLELFTFLRQTKDHF